MHGNCSANTWQSWDSPRVLNLRPVKPLVTQLLCIQKYILGHFFFFKPLTKKVFLFFSSFNSLFSPSTNTSCIPAISQPRHILPGQGDIMGALLSLEGQALDKSLQRWGLLQSTWSEHCAKGARDCAHHSGHFLNTYYIPAVRTQILALLLTS